MRFTERLTMKEHLQQNYGMEATYEDNAEDKHSFPPAVWAPEAVIVSA